jgi:hypothetical protein
MVWLLALGAACMAAWIGFLLGRQGTTTLVVDDEDASSAGPPGGADHALPVDDDLERSGVRPSKRPAAAVTPPVVQDKATVEFQAALDPHEEITAQGANQMATLARATVDGENDERTSFYQPDMQTLESLRALAANADNAREVRTSGFVPRASQDRESGGAGEAASAPRQLARK